MERWDWTLEGTKHEACKGTGSVYLHGDLHRSPGFVPCPGAYVQPEGFPVCHDGVLHFTDHDKRHWPRWRNPRPPKQPPLPPKPPRAMKRIPIKAAKEIAEAYGYDQVVIYARRVGDDPAPHGEHMTTYGVSKLHCEVAAKMGSVLKKFMGWRV